MLHLIVLVGPTVVLDRDRMVVNDKRQEVYKARRWEIL
jgi:hypothetical protein